MQSRCACMPMSPGHLQILVRMLNCHRLPASNLARLLTIGTLTNSKGTTYVYMGIIHASICARSHKISRYHLSGMRTHMHSSDRAFVSRHGMHMMYKQAICTSRYSSWHMYICDLEDRAQLAWYLALHELKSCSWEKMHMRAHVRSRKPGYDRYNT